MPPAATTVQLCFHEFFASSQTCINKVAADDMKERVVHDYYTGVLLGCYLHNASMTSSPDAVILSKVVGLSQNRQKNLCCCGIVSYFL